jgi:hypothetical protein
MTSKADVDITGDVDRVVDMNMDVSGTWCSIGAKSKP